MDAGTLRLGEPMRVLVGGVPASFRVWDGAGWRTVGGAATPAPVDPDTLTELRHIATHTAWFRSGNTAGEPVTTSISEHTVRTPARALRLVWGRHADDNLSPSGRCGIVIRGITHWVTWDGSDTLTLTAGERTRVSDPIPDTVVVNAGDTIHTVIETPHNSFYADGPMRWTSPAKRIIEGHFNGITGSMVDPGVSGAPQGIYGLTVPEWDKSVALVGDSFAEVGWGRYALHAAGLAWSDLGQWAEATPAGLPPGRLPAAGGVPYPVIVTYYGGNDSRLPLADQQAKNIAHWRALAATGANVAIMTLHPYTTTTDGWTTVEGQSHIPERRESDRTARNDWVRDGAPLDTTTWEPYAAGTTSASATRIGEPGHPVALPPFDQADACETSRNSGIWRVDGGAWTGDGTHLTQHGSAMLQPYFEAWVQANLT